MFTSATLAVDLLFTHFAERITSAISARNTSGRVRSTTCDRLSVICLKTRELRSAAHTESQQQTVMPSRKRRFNAFLFFTSHRSMQFAANLLSSRTRYPLLVQGQALAELVWQFVEKGNVLLLGTASFWEGVDVRGDALSCVVIDNRRLPHLMIPS